MFFSQSANASKMWKYVRGEMLMITAPSLRLGARRRQAPDVVSIQRVYVKTNLLLSTDWATPQMQDTKDRRENGKRTPGWRDVRALQRTR